MLFFSSFFWGGRVVFTWKPKGQATILGFPYSETYPYTSKYNMTTGGRLKGSPGPSRAQLRMSILGGSTAWLLGV